MLMELLSSSPRTTDIYAHCSMSSVIELVPVDLEEYILPTLGYSPKKIIRGGSETEREEPLNDHITPEEKLEIALEMAKCLAAMHGYEDGVIAHVRWILILFYFATFPRSIMLSTFIFLFPLSVDI